jgi:replication-associated recombination protein RarA
LLLFWLGRSFQGGENDNALVRRPFVPAVERRDAQNKQGSSCAQLALDIATMFCVTEINYP